MSLIKCPECGEEISDRADVCIHCGYPIQRNSEKEQQTTMTVAESLDRLILLIITYLCCFFVPPIGIIFMWLWKIPEDRNRRIRQTVLTVIFLLCIVSLRK